MKPEIRSRSNGLSAPAATPSSWLSRRPTEFQAFLLRDSVTTAAHLLAGIAVCTLGFPLVMRLAFQQPVWPLNLTGSMLFLLIYVPLRVLWLGGMWAVVVSGRTNANAGVCFLPCHSTPAESGSTRKLSVRVGWGLCLLALIVALAIFQSHFGSGSLGSSSYLPSESSRL